MKSTEVVISADLMSSVGTPSQGKEIIRPSTSSHEAIHSLPRPSHPSRVASEWRGTCYLDTAAMHHPEKDRTKPARVLLHHRSAAVYGSSAARYHSHRLPPTMCRARHLVSSRGADRCSGQECAQIGWGGARKCSVPAGVDRRDGDGAIEAPWKSRMRP